jgi:hypothetical protein
MAGIRMSRVDIRVKILGKVAYKGLRGVVAHIPNMNASLLKDLTLDCIFKRLPRFDEAREGRHQFGWEVTLWWQRE